MSASASSGSRSASHFERDFVGAAVLGPRSADGAGDGGIDVRARAGDHAAGEGQALNSCSAYRFSEMCMARTHSSLGFSPCSRCRNGRRCCRRRSARRWCGRCGCSGTSTAGPSQVGHQAVGDVARAGRLWSSFSGSAAQHRHGRAHHVHRVAGGGQRFQRQLQLRQAAQAAQLSLGLQFGLGRQLPWTSRWAISSNSQVSATSRMS